MVIEGEFRAGGLYDVVRVDGSALTPARANKVAASPAGFGWGYHGSGPRHLALAILLAAGLSEPEAREWAVAFSDEILVPLAPDQGFRLEIDVLDWLARRWGRAEPKDSF